MVRWPRILRGCFFPKIFPTLAKFFVVPYILLRPLVHYLVVFEFDYWLRMAGGGTIIWIFALAFTSARALFMGLSPGS